MKNPLIKIFEDTYQNTFEYNFLELFKENKDKIDKSEILIFYLWLISKVFKNSPDFLDEIHQTYVDKVIFSKEKIMERYSLYYKEWDDINIGNQELLVLELGGILGISTLGKSYFINQFINLSYQVLIDIKKEFQLEGWIINYGLHKSLWEYIYSGKEINYEEYTILGEYKNGFQKIGKDKFKRYIDDLGYLDSYKQFNFINENNQIISKIDFDEVEDFQKNGFSIVKLYNEKDNKFYSKLLHKSGYLSKNNFDEIYNFEDNDYALVKIDGGINIVDRFGSLLFNKNFEDTRGYSEGFYTFKYEGKWNFFNEKNYNFLSADWFDEVLPFENGFATVMKINYHYNGFLFNYIDINGNLLFDKYINEYELDNKLIDKIDTDIKNQDEDEDYNLILSLCDLGIEKFPENSFYYYAKSISLYEIGQKTDSLEFINEALKIDPFNEDFSNIKKIILGKL